MIRTRLEHHAVVCRLTRWDGSYYTVVAICKYKGMLVHHYTLSKLISIQNGVCVNFSEVFTHQPLLLSYQFDSNTHTLFSYHFDSTHTHTQFRTSFDYTILNVFLSIQQFCIHPKIIHHLQDATLNQCRQSYFVYTKCLWWCNTQPCTVYTLR